MTTGPKAPVTEIRAPVPGLPWIGRLAMLLPAIGVIVLAAPRLISGFALEAAFPATTEITMNMTLPQATNKFVAQVLSHASPSDGETQILRAEAAVNAGFPPGMVIPIVRSALIREPTDARGWILLAALLKDHDPKGAASALSLAIELAPREYYLVIPRAFVGASLWNYLSKDVQARIVDDAHVIATSNEFRGGLQSLLDAQGGTELVGRALAGHPDQLRALNRSLARERLGP